VSRRIVFPVTGTLNVWNEVLCPTSSGAPEVGGKRGAEPCSCSCPRSLSNSSSERPLNTSRFLFAEAAESGLVKGSRLVSGTDTAGSFTPLASGQTTSGIVEGGTPSTDTLMVCPPGDTTSAEVGLGPKIDSALIFFVEEKRDTETESFLSVAISRASLYIIYKKDIPVGVNSLGLPESGLRWKSELVWRAIFGSTFLKAEDKIMKLRWRTRVPRSWWAWLGCHLAA
jgi:hypothetical protein